VFDSGHSDLYYASANNMAVRRRTLEELGGFEERRRGGDTLFVRRVVEARSPAAVSYASQMVVRHLEVAAVQCGTITARASPTARACGGSAART
jgi:hypothetical protein